MHNGFEGTPRKGRPPRLVYSWSDPQFFSEKYYVPDFAKNVDENLIELKLPTYVQRCLESISEYKGWKASQHKKFSIYLSLIMLQNVLPFEYFEHLKLYIHGISILCKSSITRHEVDIAENHLKEFLSRYEYLHTTRHLTCSNK